MNTPIAIHARATIETAAKVPTFESVFYTGGPLTIGGYDLPVVIDLAGLQNGNVLVANLDHDPTKRVGNFRVENDGTKLVAHGTASASTPWRDEVVASAKAGYTWQASLEVQPHKVETIKRGSSVTVNGQTVTGPAYITRKGTLKGFAFVSHGADDNTTVAIAATRKRGTRMENYSDFQSWMAGTFPTVDTSLLTPAELANWHANYSGRNEPIAADFSATAPMIFAAADPVEAEQRRLRQIDAACRDTWGEYSDRVDELKAAAIGGDFSVDELLSHLRGIRREKSEASIPMARTISASRRDNSGIIIEAAFCLAGGLTDVEKHFPEQVLDHASRLQRDTGLQSLLMQAACQHGYQAAPAEGISQGNLRRVLEAAFAPQHASTGFSTLSLPGILSNVANKYLEDGWQETSGDEWKKISEVKPVKNFKTNTFYRLVESGEYEQVGPAGEIKHGTFGEASMTVKASTYGRMYAITREAIINDDLGALTDAPRRLGRAAGMKFRRVFWQAFLLSADNFFHATNGNVVTGAGTALTADGSALQTALTAFRGMRTSAADGRKLIGGKPATILIPPELEIVARKLLNSSGIVATGDTDTTMPDGNPFKGFAELVVCDWLSDSDLTDYSAAEWYLLRSPSIAPAMIVAFLNGNQSPTVESASADFNTLGVQMRGYHDFGVGRGEPLCGVQVAGTAAEG